MLGTSRWPSIIQGWGDLAFVRNVSFANRAAHVIDHLPGAIIRTVSSITEPRPIVILMANESGRLFGMYISCCTYWGRVGFGSLVVHFCGTDDDDLVLRIISCIDLRIDAAQKIGMLCVVPQKTREIAAALTDTLNVTKNVLVRVRTAAASL